MGRGDEQVLGLASSDHDVDGCPLGEEGLLQVSMLLHLYRVPRNDGEIAVTGLTAFKKGRSFGGYMS